MKVKVSILEFSKAVCKHVHDDKVPDFIIIEAEPIEEEWPKMGERYYLATIDNTDFVTIELWDDYGIDIHRKAHNLIFRTEEEAIARSKEILEKIK